MEYPEHDKMTKRIDENEAISNFVEWLESNGFFICSTDSESVGGCAYWPVSSMDKTIAAFFGVDPIAFEKEKRAMLAEIRNLNNKEK